MCENITAGGSEDDISKQPLLVQCLPDVIQLPRFPITIEITGIFRDCNPTTGMQQVGEGCLNESKLLCMLYCHNPSIERIMYL